ncbi:MAG: hypothetical protein GX817_04405, partial [Elusimicrobia bacterium]|nr:hypothetical protein [Elusimicrobiota bacterium]
MIFSGKEKEEFIRLTHEVEVLAKQKAELTREKQELEKALAQLKYNDSVFSNFRANISLPLVLFDNTLKIIYANHKAAQYFELPINNIIGNNFYKLYSPESQGSYQDIDSFFTAELEGKIDKVIKGVGNHQKNITLIDFNKVLDNAGKLSFGYIFFTEYRDPAGRSYLKDSRTNILAPPRNVKETGLSMDFIGELILKLIYSYGEITNLEISEELCLPLDEVIQPVMTFLKKDLGFCANVAVTEENVGRTDQYINILTDMGRERVREALDRNQYVGPAPITLELYKEIVIEQMGTPRPMKISEVKESLSHMVFDDKMFKKLTTAINSRGSIFLHGEPGNGKSSISKVCSRVNKNYVILPYAIEVEGQIIKVFDSIYHKQLS